MPEAEIEYVWTTVKVPVAYAYVPVVVVYAS